MSASSKAAINITTVPKSSLSCVGPTSCNSIRKPFENFKSNTESSGLLKIGWFFSVVGIGHRFENVASPVICMGTEISGLFDCWEEEDCHFFLGWWEEERGETVECVCVLLLPSQS